MKSVKFLQANIAGALLLIGGGWCAGQTWTQTAAPSNHWTSVACSADGTQLVACASSVGNGLIYLSTNSGATWNPTTAPSKSWISVASSADGSTLLAGEAYYGPGGIWKSINGGLNWAQTAAPEANGFSALACSADGSNIVAAVPAGAHDSGWLFTSTNGGASWTAADMSIELFTSVAGSADGRRWIAVCDGGAWQLFSSSDFGQTWPQRLNVGATHWMCVAASAEGGKLVAATGDSLYLSGDAGSSWTVSSAPSADWRAVACSADGTKLVAVAGDLPPYTSTDSGLTWKAASAPATNWAAVTSSGDGNRIAAVMDGGGIYILGTPSAPSSSIATSGNSLLISWAAPSTRFVLQERAESGTWSDVSTAPVLNNTNLHYEVRVSAPESPRFYRLVSP